MDTIMVRIQGKLTKLFSLVFILISFVSSSSGGELIMTRETLREKLVRLEKENNWCIAGLFGLDSYEIRGVSLKKGGKLYRISTPVTKGQRLLHGLSSSIDGLQFAFWKTWEDDLYIMTDDLYITKSDGSSPKKSLSLKEEVMSGLEGGSTSWSSSGKFIASVVNYGVGKKGEDICNLCIIDIETGKVKILIHDIYGISSQAWSPDGNKIVYESSKKVKMILDFAERPGQEIMVFDINTKETTKIAEGKCPAWSPDGRKIAYKDKDGNCYLINPDGSNKELLIKEKTSFFDDYIRGIHHLRGTLLWSPDSKFIILYDRTTRMKSHECTFYIMDVETKERIRIINRTRGYHFIPSVWISIPKGISY